MGWGLIVREDRQHSEKVGKGGKQVEGCDNVSYHCRCWGLSIIGDPPERSGVLAEGANLGYFSTNSRTSLVTEFPEEHLNTLGCSVCGQTSLGRKTQVHRKLCLFYSFIIYVLNIEDICCTGYAYSILYIG